MSTELPSLEVPSEGTTLFIVRSSSIDQILTVQKARYLLNTVGPRGPTGPTGPAGDTGPTGPTGSFKLTQNSQSANYTLVESDAGKHILHPSSDTNSRTFTIPANSSVAFEIGTTITFINETFQALTINIISDTMYLSSSGLTGSRTLSQYGIATAIKTASTTWYISGTGLT
jgi:hypothetical protein